MLKSGLLTVALLAGAQSAAAQQPVGGGGLIQQIPAAPTPQKSIPDIRVQRGQTTPAQDLGGVTVHVAALHVTGQTRFSEAALVDASGFKPDRDLTLADLRDLAAKITAYYNQRGYILAQAYVPAQEIKGGSVTIAVIEGRYGQVAVRNDSRLSNRLAHDMLSGLKPGDLVVSAPLERRLLLLSDLPGVQVTSTLSPGSEVGDSDLTVHIGPGPFISGDVEADNAGSRYTGEIRGGGTVNFNDVTGHGDVVSLRALTSGFGLTYLRGSYQTQWRDFTVGVAYSGLWYRLGQQFTPLDATGTAQDAGLYASYPLIRSRENNLYVQGTFDFKTFHDEIGSTSSATEKTVEVVGIGVSGDHRDRFFGGGSDTYALTVSGGNLDIGTGSARLLDAATAHADGGYGKLSFYVDRVQTLAGPFSVFGAVRGQAASKNLDLSEKMELGGVNGVRAYPEGEAYGDQGYVATVEGRVALPTWRVLPGRTQLFAFADTGQVDTVKSPWLAGPNSLTRSGGGVGFLWADSNNFVLRVTYAARFGAAKTTSGPDASSRVWVQLVKFF